MAYNVDYAVKILEVALEFNNLWQYLVGLGGYNLDSPDGYGGKEHNTTLVMQSIYKKYESDLTIADKLEQSILYYFNISKNGSGILKILEIIKYQMSSEKIGTAPFKLDCEKLLIAAKENILKNKEMYEKHFSDLPTGTFIGEFKYYDDDFNAKYGRRILWTVDELINEINSNE